MENHGVNIVGAAIELAELGRKAVDIEAVDIEGVDIEGVDIEAVDIEGVGGTLGCGLRLPEYTL